MPRNSELKGEPVGISRAVRGSTVQRSVLALVAIFVAIVSAATLSPALPQSLPETGSVLTVQGEGTINVAPDYARLEVAVITEGKTLEEAAAAHPDRAGQATSALSAMRDDGVVVEKSSFQLGQPRDPSFYARELRRDGQPPSFLAETIFTLRINRIDRLNAIVTRLANTGLLRIRRMKFRVGDERDARNQARRAAVEDAKDQARAYADAAGVRLGDIAVIADGRTRQMEGEADMPVSLSVEIIPPANVTYYASVNMTWRISPQR